MLFKFLMFVFFGLICSLAYSQELISIQADRPDQTESPYTTPKGWIQGEAGFSQENIEDNYSSFSHPSLLLKYGLSERFEFRLITESVTEKIFTKRMSGLLPVTVGFKVSICEEKGILPKTSLLGHLSIPGFASENFKAPYYAPSFRFTMQHTLSNRVSLSYNLGAEWDGETPEPTFIYTLTTGIGITSKLGSYLEVYGFAPQQHSADHRIDGGLTYLVTNDLLLDISGGVGISPNAPDNYFAAGVSYRFNTKRKK